MFFFANGVILQCIQKRVHANYIQVMAMQFKFHFQHSGTMEQYCVIYFAKQSMVRLF